MKKQESTDQDRGPGAEKVELEKRLDSNTKLEKEGAGKTTPEAESGKTGDSGKK